MALHQLSCRRAHQRADAGLHEFGMPAIQLIARMGGKRRELEIEERVDVQRTGLVLAEEFVVARLVMGAVEHALVDQEARPFVVAVAIEQRVVQIKKHEVQLQAPSVQQFR